MDGGRVLGARRHVDHVVSIACPECAAGAERSAEGHMHAQFNPNFTKFVYESGPHIIFRIAPIFSKAWVRQKDLSTKSGKHHPLPSSDAIESACEAARVK